MPSSAGDGSSFSSTSRSSTEGSPSRSAAKFRHMFAQSSRREEWLDWGAGRASLIAVNPKFAAVALEGQAGGPVLIGRVSDVGKHPEMRKLDENRTPVTELRWSEFNDNVLASGNAGGVVLVWHVEDSLKTSVVRQLRRCSRRIECVQWHSTVDNLLLVASADPLIALWDVSSDVLVHETSSVHANYLSLSPSSSLFATVSKTAQRLSLFDSRSGVSLKSSRLVHDGAMSPRCVFLDEDKVVTTGSSPSRRRQLAVYSLSSFSSPIAVIDVDGGSGVLLPFADLDLSLLYVTGKGDLTLRVFLLTPSSPFLVYQTECQQSQSHTAVALQPKRVVRVKDCELARFFRLDPQQLLLQPLSLVVPRRSHVFQADLYPPTRSATPALRVEEWLAGLERAPVPLQLAPGQPSHATSKPVLLSQSQLITADANNERKFRFLSQVTKPDYREISAREDREEMVREASVKEELGAKKNSLSSMDCDEEEDPTRADDVEGEVEGDEVEGEDVSCVEEVEKRTAEVEAPPTATVHTCEQLDLVPWTANELPEERQAPAVAEGDRGEACWGERRMLEEALSVLERELRRSEARRERLERLLALQQQDIDSLRYEISWKDSRIDWLQTELARVQPPSAGTVEEESVDED